MDYQDFIERKKITDVPTGFEPSDATYSLFPFQIDIMRWACRRGRAAVFADCGTGKTLIQLAWANEVVEHTGGDVIIFAPHGVAPQTVQEGIKFGIKVTACASQADVRPGINITNYEKMHKFDLTKFIGFVADESGILKSLDGATRTMTIELTRQIPYKLACTATPAPNDYMELGNHAEFLGVMSRTEMLSTFFIHDSANTGEWRLKGHAQEEFWRWMCSWAVNIRKPSDIGHSDDGFILPHLKMYEHIVTSEQQQEGFLFAMPASTLQERRTARKESLGERINMAASLAKDGGWLIWCDLNAEQDALEKLFGDRCVSIRGATDEDKRLEMEQRWRKGEVPIMITKSSIFGWGMNWQHCHNVMFVGLSDSYEAFYQAVRRVWRFGQKQPVNAHIIISDLEGAVLSNIKRKEADATNMANEMIQHMSAISTAEIKSMSRETISYNPTIEMTLPHWM